MANVDQYLRDVMQGKYVHLDSARMDVLNAVSNYKDLQPTIDAFVFNNGSRKSLLCLKGTIPVSYKGSRYNIPIAIWLQETHPQIPPICFVQPTSTMQVRQGKHVDSNGRIYLPYLTDWRQGTHFLTGCIQIMTVVFGEEPPVFSKPARPPQPHGARLPPATQPYPSHPTPYPRMPGYTPQGPPTTSYQPNFTSSTPYPPVSNPQPPYPAVGANFSPYPSYPAGNQPTQSQYVGQSIPRPQKDSTLDDRMIRASLISAVNEKLKRRLGDTVAQAEQEVNTLKKTETKLKEGQEKIQTILQGLGTELDEVEANIVMLQSKNEELTNEISKLQSKQDNLDVDDVVMATTPVYRQIVSTFAEEQAMEDTIYYLGEALHKGVIDTDMFLKQVRNLSRQQFMLRAVIQKARRTSGLADVY